MQVSNEIRITDRIFSTFIEKVEKTMKLSILQAISARQNPQNFLLNDRLTFKRNPFDSVGDIFAKEFKKKPSQTRITLYNKLMAPRFFAPSLRNELVAKNADLRSNLYFLNQINLQQEFAFLEGINAQYIQNVINGFGWEEWQSQGNLRGITELQFKLHKVKCIDETDPELFGNDRIALAGITIDSTGNMKRINQFVVRNDFKDGISEPYNPPLILRRFRVTNNYPQIFFSTLFLSEKDNGGFGNFISDAYNSIRNELQNILERAGAAAGQYISNQIGMYVGDIGGELGQIISILAGKILHGLFQWLAEAFQDDIFTPLDDHISTIILPNNTASFNGSDSTAERNMTFVGHGGKYQIKYSWSVVRQ